MDREKVLVKHLETMRKLWGKIVLGRKFTREEKMSADLHHNQHIGRLRIMNPFVT